MAEQEANIASKSIHKEKVKMWKALNDLGEVRLMIWINEIPWHKININDELYLKTSNEFTQTIETKLRRTIYRWKYMQVDMIVEPTILCYLEIENAGFVMSESVNIARTDQRSDIFSREFKPQIDSEKNIEKIKSPKIVYRKNDTEKKFQTMQEIFNGILEVKKVGYPRFWFSPWGELIRWCGMEKLLADLILRPNLVHKVMSKLTKSYIKQLNEYEKNNLLLLTNGNFRIGSGALGCTNELPEISYSGQEVQSKLIWSSNVAQIFSAVSPQMHEEFALSYKIHWLKKFGLTYYVCCEPLDKKIDILRKIPNLRKIYMKPWVDLKLGAENIIKDCVFSYKSSPSIFLSDYWNPEDLKMKLIEYLEKIKNCNIEIIMKDISTVRYKPQRLWEWARISTEVVEEIY